MLTLFELQKTLPPFLFTAMLIYVGLFILRIKRLIKLPFFVIGIVMILIPGIFFILPFLGIVELLFHMNFFYKQIKA
ncbi:hypothetical protein SAMN04489761_3477 [Tenacibaculum sp. MAR_2009_124]|nr:hypothetical protein SAMN04489761_3477 [Tenacibaculum sp. MAR_2009_124]